MVDPKKLKALVERLTPEERSTLDHLVTVAVSPAPPAPPAKPAPVPAPIHWLLENWRTGVCGLVTIAAAVLPVIPGIPPVFSDVAHALIPVACGGGLLLARDGKRRPAPRH